MEGELVTSISGLSERKPATETIQAIEPTRTLSISLNKVDELYQLRPEFNINVRKLLELYYQDAENRAFIARLAKAEHRYRMFMERHPQQANRVPLKYIASFLGLTHETLSRVRAKLLRQP
jgi:CRP-like cAMP-binding protein